MGLDSYVFRVTKPEGLEDRVYSLDEIKAVVKQNFDKTVEFVDIAPAEQYRQSLSIDHLEDVVMVNDIDDLEDDLI